VSCFKRHKDDGTYYIRFINIHIYVFGRCFYLKDLQFPGIRTHDHGVANAMLY